VTAVADPALGFLRVKPAALGLFGQVTPFSGDLFQAFSYVAIGRALGALLCLSCMLAVLFGS